MVSESSAAGSGAPGTVLGRPDAALPFSEVDVLVVGGGLLGLAAAHFLRALEPDASVLVVERGGVPSEEGETYVSPSIAAPGLLPEGYGSAVDWALEAQQRPRDALGIQVLDSARFVRCGVLSFDPVGGGAGSGAPSDPEVEAALRAMVRLERLPSAGFDPRGGYGSAEQLALAFGRAAVAAGAHLLLNGEVRARSEGEFRIDRYGLDRSMRRVRAASDLLRAGRVVVAAGHGAGELLEAGLGATGVERSAYLQYPRLDRDERLPVAGGRVRLPVVRAAGFTFRPHGDGLLVVPPPLPPDPEGYRPAGTRFLGVPVGLRRELLERLEAALPDLPVLGWASLNLGKTSGALRGAWSALPGGGPPVLRSLAGGRWLQVAGGPHGFALAPALGYEVAARLAGARGRPWNPEGAAGPW